MGHNYDEDIRTGTLTGDRSASAAIVAAVTSRTLSVKKVIISNSTTAAQTLTVEKADGTDLFVFHLPANSTITAEFFPGVLAGDSGAAIHIIASTSNTISVYMECYVTPRAL